MFITLEKESQESFWLLFLVVSAPCIGATCECVSLGRRVSM